MLVTLAAFAALWSTGIGRVESASADANSVYLTEDQSTGQITVESQTIKAVWHYKTLASENYNQSGGNIYELYYKPMDPTFARNLVSYHSANGWGDGHSTAVWTGIGGLGATTLYATGTYPGANQTNNFNDLLGDNNLSGVLDSHTAAIDQNGNAVITFDYRIHNQSTGKDWYKLTKKWTVEPGGAIHLDINWTILSTGYFAEPALRNGWSYDVGWDQFVKYGRDWLQPGQPKYLLGSSGISSQTCNCWDSLNRFVPDWYALTGSQQAPTVVMAPDTGGLGFAGLGSYQLGVNAWGSAANPVQEECTLTSQYANAHVINWMASWGGNPPLGNRYKLLTSGTSWSDSYRIDLSTNVPDNGAVISAVSVQELTGSSVRASWISSTDADSVVEVSANPDDATSWHEVARDNTLTRNHSLVAGQLDPATTYTFRLKSKDGSGRLSVSSGYAATGASGPPFNLSLTQDVAHWSSYSDYVNQLLTVSFSVGNQGPAEARSINIVAADSSHGVTEMTRLPVAIGALGAGTTSRLDLVYRVPTGVVRFNTKVYSAATSDDGVVFYYPSPATP
ncbi:MAG: fibronectin type III domain-containing protein [Actinobacteria bacterium]|nr:fibronectin type III domain-containing protein [Actinomycetota bacterium]